MGNLLGEIVKHLREVYAAQRETLRRLDKIEGQLAGIIAMLAPSPPVRLTITLEENTMGAVAMDFQILDNGSATAALNLVDAAGLPTTLPTGATLSVPPWVSSDPGLVATPSANGLTAVISPATPPKLLTGATITAGPATITNADGSTVTLPAVTSGPIDVIAGGPVGFTLSL
jgi:hypothetical protein